MIKENLKKINGRFAIWKTENLGYEMMDKCKIKIMRMTKGISK